MGLLPSLAKIHAKFGPLAQPIPEKGLCMVHSWHEVELVPKILPLTQNYGE